MTVSAACFRMGALCFAHDTAQSIRCGNHRRPALASTFARALQSARA